MTDEPIVQIVIVPHPNNIPDVACNVPAIVSIASPNGDVHTTFAAVSLNEMAAKGMAESNKLDTDFVKNIESRFFRTDKDSGADSNTMMIWNTVRTYLGMNSLTKGDLPTWCKKCEKYHVGSCQ